MQAVRVDQLSKRFDQTLAVAGVSLTIAPGELFTLLGPSGCGKTTLLRLLAGLEQADGGAIYFGDSRVEGEPAHKRNIGMVFQNYAVFPHMTVADNVAYGLRARKLPAAEVTRRVQDSLTQVEMTGYGERRPDQLSGGQQQRVALARALATRPALLLMDEPLSNLDAKLRHTMRAEIRRLQKQVGITCVYVTHDQEEALAISDRIGVMDGGKLLQVGSPLAIYSRPAHRAVAAFVGTCSFLEREGALLGLRPEALRPRAPGTAPGPATGEALLTGIVTEEAFLGTFVSLQVRLEAGESVTALSMRPPGTFTAGSAVALTYRPEDGYRFDLTTGEAL